MSNSLKIKNAARSKDKMKRFGSSENKLDNTVGRRKTT
jgi:hypothetical protein